MANGIRNRKTLLSVWRRAFLTFTALLALALTGCAPLHKPPALPPGPLNNCEALFRQVDKAVDRAGVQDHGPARIAGFPYLRVNRFLASFRKTAVGSAQVQAWTGRLAALDAKARDLELRNLGRPVAGLPRPRLEKRLDSCRSQLVDNLRRDPAQLDALRKQAVVPEDYVTGWRVLGLYPLTSLVVLDRILAGHEKMQRIFDWPLDRLPIKGRLIRWREPPPSYLLPVPLTLPHDALGIPEPSPEMLRQLFRLHAPIWEVDVASDNDLIGTPVWRHGPAVDTDRATEYRKVSYARFGDQVLLQLNYIIWFKARPGDDIYAGKFDGLIWQVTLGPNGAPLIYDSIHNCGCYLSFFPTPSLRLRRDLPHSDFEPPFVPQGAPAEPLVVRLDHGRHFIVRVYTATHHRNLRPLTGVAYDRLRSLPGATGYHSLFGQFGLVPGSQRPERFLLWPMGVRSPGAMRQWGHHAVSFVGRRYFDDPWMIQSLFKKVPQ